MHRGNEEWRDVTPRAHSVAYFNLATSISGQGTIEPAQLITIPDGYSTNLSIHAINEDHHIAGISAYGETLYHNTANRGIQSTNITLTITNDVTIDVTFMPSTTISGIPLAWLSSYGITNKQDDIENMDLDGDGFTVLEEYVADTNPTNATSFFHPLLATRTPTSAVFTVEASSTQRVYMIQQTDVLLAPGPEWTTITNQTGTGSTWTWENSIQPDDRAFFRSGVRLPN